MRNERIDNLPILFCQTFEIYAGSRIEAKQKICRHIKNLCQLCK